jgi:hypothetical protein
MISVKTIEISQKIEVKKSITNTIPKFRTKL